ncbi:MAG: tyrosine-type recombinase/integrase [Ignavibacteriales bacterium]
MLQGRRKGPRRGRRLPEVLTDEERRALLSQPNPDCPTGLRNLCLLRLMLNAGLRAAEVLNVKTRDLNWNTGKLIVRQGKGKKDRVLWLGEDDLALLARWREGRRAQSDLLFTTLAGERLNDRYLRAMVKRYARKAGIPRDVHPHTLRHTFATDLYKDSHDILVVQKALGHAYVSTTSIYTHLVDDDVEDAMLSFAKNRK